MMQRIVSIVIAVLLLAVIATPALGQAPASPAGEESELRYFDYFVSRYGGAGMEDERRDAVGGRVMWSLSPFSGALATPVFGRAALGGYFVHSRDDRERDEEWRFGTQADVRLMTEPLLGRVDPIVSLGVGAVRHKEPTRRQAGSTDGGIVDLRPPLAPLSIHDTVTPGRTFTALSVTPGLGARVRLVPGLDLRSDARQVIDFHEELERRLEVSAGISIWR